MTLKKQLIELSDFIQSETKKILNPILRGTFEKEFLLKKVNRESQIIHYQILKRIITILTIFQASKVDKNITFKNEAEVLIKDLLEDMQKLSNPVLYNHYYAILKSVWTIYPEMEMPIEEIRKAITSTRLVASLEMQRS